MEIIMIQLFLIGILGIILTGIIQKLTLLDLAKKARKETLQLVGSSNWRSRNVR